MSWATLVQVPINWWACVSCGPAGSNDGCVEPSQTPI